MIFRKGVGFVCLRHLDTIYSCLLNHSMWQSDGVCLFFLSYLMYYVVVLYFIIYSFPLLKRTKKLDLLSFSWILQATPLTRPDRYTALHSLDACRFITFWIATKIIGRSGCDLFVPLKSLDVTKWCGLFVLFKLFDVLSCYALFYYMFFSIAEKNQKARLTIIFLNSTAYSTNASRPLHCVTLFGRLPFYSLWITTEIIDRSGFDLFVPLKSLGFDAVLCCCVHLDTIYLFLLNHSMWHGGVLFSILYILFHCWKESKS